MKVLICSNFILWNVPFGTEIEIAIKHIKKGDDVHFLTCSGSMSSCDVNPNHLLEKCVICNVMKHDGLKYLKLPEENYHDFNLKQFEKDFFIPRFNHISELEEFEVDGINFGREVASSMISYFRNHEVDVYSYHYLVEKMLRTAVSIYHSVDFYIKKLGIDIIHIYNSRMTTTRPVLRAANQNKITSYVSQTMDNSYIMVKNTYLHDLEYMKNEFEQHWEKNSDFEQKKEICRSMVQS